MNQEAISDAWIQIATILSAVSTLVIAIFTWLTWCVYRAQLAAAKLSDRAWLVPDIGLIEKTSVGGTSQVIVKVLNTGKTPAWVKSAGSNGWWVDRDHPLPGSPKYTVMSPFPQRGSPLSPGGYIPQGISLSDAQLARAVRGEISLYVFGFVEYEDIYGTSHRTRYSYRAQNALDLTHPQPLDFYVDGPDGYLEAT